jgi:thimet oligopeptidase
VSPSPPTISALTLPAAADAEEWVATRATEGLDRARELAETLRSDPPTEALAALAVWDQLSLELSNVSALGGLFSNVHPLEAVRDTAERAEQDAMRLSTELTLDRRIYDVFAGLEPAGLDPQSARLLDKVLETFTRAGVDGDEETRARVTAINERITEVDQAFGKVIRDDVRSIKVAPERLDGMPADWMAAHPVDDEGLVTITTH